MKKIIRYILMTWLACWCVALAGYAQSEDPEYKIPTKNKSVYHQEMQRFLEYYYVILSSNYQNKEAMRNFLHDYIYEEAVLRPEFYITSQLNVKQLDGSDYLAAFKKEFEKYTEEDALEFTLTNLRWEDDKFYSKNDFECYTIVRFDLSLAVNGKVRFERECEAYCLFPTNNDPYTVRLWQITPVKDIPLDTSPVNVSRQAAKYPASTIQQAIRLFEEKQYDKSFSLFVDLAAKKDAYALFYTGLSYSYGYGTTQNHNQAFKYFQEAAKKKHGRAMNAMGLAYERGEGVAKDIKKAIKWYEKAIKQEEPRAYANLGWLYYWGELVKQDRVKGEEYLQKAAETGNRHGQHCYGLMLLSTGDLSGESWLIKAAEQNNETTQTLLAKWYYEGYSLKQDRNKAFKWAQKGAEQGNATAQGYLGNCYFYGYGTDKNYVKASEWYTKSAQKDNYIGQYGKGKIYAEATTPPNYKEATAWFKRSAEQGYYLAQYTLVDYALSLVGPDERKRYISDVEAFEWQEKCGYLLFNYDKIESLADCYLLGRDVIGNKKKLTPYYKTTAKAGSAESQYTLGNLYDCDGKYDLAATWYRKAAEQGHMVAQFYLGYLYWKGKGVSQDFTEAKKWFSQSANQGLAAAQNMLGQCHYLGKGVNVDYEEAVKWWQKAAEQNDSHAQFNLGLCYDDGKGVDMDQEEAIKWWQKAAEQNNSNAQYNLGYCYCHYGIIVNANYPDNYAEAVKWYLRAAKQGNEYAQNALGDCYRYEKGVTKDYKKAAEWFKKAAEQGYAPARYNLGICYEYGNGVPKSLSLARDLYQGALELGYKKAQRSLDRIDKLLIGKGQL